MVARKNKQLTPYERLINFINTPISKFIAFGSIASGLIWIGSFSMEIKKNTEISDMKEQERKKIEEYQDQLAGCKEEGRELKYENFILKHNPEQNEPQEKK